MATQTGNVSSLKWKCEIHSTECSLGHPCYECKREIQNPEIVERDVMEKPAVRERNSKPRARI